MRTAPPKKDRPQRPKSNSSSTVGYRRSQPRPQPASIVRSLSNAVVGSAVILALLMGAGLWRSGDRFFDGLRLMLTPPEPPAPEVDVRSVVVQQVRGASELTTAIFAMEAVVPATSDRSLGGYVIGSTKLLYVAYGEVRAGVDLSQITADSIRLDPATSSLEITLPPAKILDSKLDLSRSNVFDYDRGFLGLGPDNAPQLQELAQQEALAKIVQAACSESILQEANSRAELAVRQLLSTAGFETVTVITQPAAEPICAASSQSNPSQSNPSQSNPSGESNPNGESGSNGDTVN